MSKPAFFLIVFQINFKANQQTNIGIIEYYLHKSSIRDFKLEKGESRTNPPIKGSLELYIIAVTAPIDLPQNPIVDILSKLHK